VPWQRCQFHLQQNAQQFAPSLEMRAQIGADLRGIFNAQCRAEAEDRLRSIVIQYRPRLPKFADWL
jgi:transposase-like protein